MAERSSPAVAALVRTSCTFPDTTTRANTTGEEPTFDTESERSARGAALAAPSPLALSTTQTPTPVTSELAAAPAAPAAGPTTTVMPSATSVAGGGSTC